MAWNRIQAARLLTDKEMELFEGSLADHAPQMSDQVLDASIKRARAQRDKYQDLLRRQRVASRERSGTKSGSGGVANARTAQKVQVFSEALDRLESQRDRRERRSELTAARRPPDTPARNNTVRAAVRSALEAKTRGLPGDKPHARRSSKAPAQSSAHGGASPAAQSPPTVPHDMRADAIGQQRPQAHISAQGRRKQARRDAR